MMCGSGAIEFRFMIDIGGPSIREEICNVFPRMEHSDLVIQK